MNHDSQVLFLCCDLKTGSVITSVYDCIVCQVRIRTVTCSKRLQLKLIKPTKMFE